MPVKVITVEPTTYEEAVDVVASAAMKQPHKRFGQYAKRLAEVLKKAVEIPKGHWQAYWTIATRVFSIAYSGHNKDVAKGLAEKLAEEMDLDPNVADEIVNAVYANLSKIIGEKSRPGAEELI